MPSPCEMKAKSLNDAAFGRRFEHQIDRFNVFDSNNDPILLLLRAYS